MHVPQRSLQALPPDLLAAGSIPERCARKAKGIDRAQRNDRRGPRASQRAARPTSFDTAPSSDIGCFLRLLFESSLVWRFVIGALERTWHAFGSALIATRTLRFPAACCLLFPSASAHIDAREASEPTSVLLLLVPHR